MRRVISYPSTRVCPACSCFWAQRRRSGQRRYRRGRGVPGSLASGLVDGCECMGSLGVQRGAQYAGLRWGSERVAAVACIANPLNQCSSCNARPPCIFLLAHAMACSKDTVEDIRLGALECMAALYYAQGRFLSIGVQETVAVAAKYCNAK